jgi:hypothetical protein
MRSDIKHQAALLIALKKVFSLSPELIRHPKIFKHLGPVVDNYHSLDELISDAGATISSMVWSVKTRPLKSMTPDELRECFKEPGFTDDYCLLKIHSFDSLYNFYTFMAQHSQANSLQWLYDHGFEIFKIIE